MILQVVILFFGMEANDFPFYKTDLMITVADPHRAGHGRRPRRGHAQTG